VLGRNALALTRAPCSQLNELEPEEMEAAALSGVRAEFQWLPRGTDVGTLVRESRGVPTFDLLALDYHTLRSEVTLSACAAGCAAHPC